MKKKKIIKRINKISDALSDFLDNIDPYVHDSVLKIDVDDYVDSTGVIHQLIEMDIPIARVKVQ